MFVTAGGMRIDYLITHDGEARVEMVGGNALYAAVGAALWDAPVHLWARVGSNYPQNWLNQLPQEQIQIDGLVRLPTPQDHRTFFAYLPNGRRDDTNPAAHFARVGQPLPAALQDYIHSAPGQDDPHNYEPLALRPDDWPEDWNEVTAVHLSPLALATHLNAPSRLRQAAVQQITLDPGERYMIPARAAQIKQILPQIDVFLPSAMEVRSLFGEGVDLAEATVMLTKWGAKWVVVKNGADGVLLADGRTQTITHIPAYHPANDPRVVDVTGAGDSFCGGFMVGLAQTGDAAQAVHYGLVSASLVIEGYGALYALSRQTEAQSRLHQRL
ncbi:carbohydrate kinase family protein [Candidatus Leptofilum sp.]|uniref:carbohydrate kinase family protein n=1 Tax=Candidatus Leptofilum sp. TaxID=3241576 RepID=UPI003B592CA5